jgi:hypothetical protein
MRAMRTTLVALLVLFSACDNSPLSAGNDLSANNNDLSVSPDLGGGCDVVKQDCPQGQKCTVITTGTGQDVSQFASCLATSGTLGLNDPCTRTAPGMDGCGAGLFCTGVGYAGTMSDPMRHCNKLCKQDMDCLTGQKCEAISDDGQSGLCTAACELLSTTCGTGLTCSLELEDIDTTDQNNPDIYLTCRSIGQGNVGDACMDDTDCGADMFCDSSNGCTQFCDDSSNPPHKCLNEGVDGGLSCSPFNGATGPGQCQ